MIWEELENTLIVPGLQAKSYEDIMRKLGGALIEQGYAKESYVDALIAREREFPTGLDIDGVGVAIPHTDVSHVCKGGIAIGILEEPVNFVEMGSEDDRVEVQLVFMLAVIEPKAHMDRLQRILAIIQDKAVLEKLIHTKETEQIIEVIKEKEQAMDEAK